MIAQIWHDKKVLAKALGLELASIGFWLNEDTAVNDISAAFDLTINVRVLGIQLGSTDIKPLKNGAFAIQLDPPVGGNVQGRIDDWRGLDANGATINADGWNGASSVGFSVVALAKVDVTFAVMAIPMGFLLKAALRAFGQPTVTIDIGHADVVEHVYHH